MSISQNVLQWAEIVTPEAFVQDGFERLSGHESELLVKVFKVLVERVKGGDAAFAAAWEYCFNSAGSPVWFEAVGEPSQWPRAREYAKGFKR